MTNAINKVEYRSGWNFYEKLLAAETKEEKQAIIDSCKNINVHKLGGWTALMYAAFDSNYEIVKLLVKH